LELANGYQECTDADQMAARHTPRTTTVAPTERHLQTQDRAFHAALEAGLPPCAGVAVGFERLLMLACNCDDISNVIAF
jgi:lysyl-tRNA synthetase class 2